MRYAIVDSLGRITQLSSHEMDLEGLSCVLIVGTISDSTHYYSGSEFVSMGPRPSPKHTFDYSIKQWIDPRSLSQQQLDQWERIKTSRNEALTAPLTTLYGVFDADTYSQKNITDAIAMLQTLAASGYPQTIEYTLFDNTVVTLSTAQMIEVGLTLGQRTQQIYATSRSLRTAIEAATTIAEVEAITWPT